MAEGLAREGLGFMERELGADHPMLGHGRGSLAETLILRGAYAEAEALYRRNLASAIRLTGQSSGRLAGELEALAGVARARGRLREKVMLAESSLAMHRRSTSTGSSMLAGGATPPPGRDSSP